MVDDSFRQRKAKTFHFYSELHEDIANHILLFIAEAPLEQSTERGNRNALSTLTHVLPLVNKTFRDMASKDFFWKECLLRQLNRDDSRRYHWQEGLQRLVPKGFAIGTDADQLDAVLLETKEKSYKDLYHKIMTTHIQGQYPIFIMPCQLRLGEPYGLHLFEPRYRIMVRDLLESSGNYAAATQQAGTDLPSEENGRRPPLLIHACLGGRLSPDFNRVDVSKFATANYGVGGKTSWASDAEGGEGVLSATVHQSHDGLKVINYGQWENMEAIEGLKLQPGLNTKTKPYWDDVAVNEHHLYEVVFIAHTENDNV